MFNKLKNRKLSHSINNIKLFALAFAFLFLWQNINAQTYTRRNSPYSRYGLGDMMSFQFLPTETMGGLKGAYNSVADINLANPASLGHLRSTAFDIGTFYKHSALTEQSTGNSARANDGNLSYLSLAFPLTRAWEVEKDSLRRGIPIQWGMAFTLSPHSTVGYDVRVLRELDDIGEVEYQYSGDGTRYRVNWGNGASYKGLALGVNLGFLFGTVSDLNTIDFRDSAYVYAFDEQFLREEYTTGLLWDLGLQYDYYFKDEEGKRERSFIKDKYLTFGFYASGSNNMSVLKTERTTRYGSFYSRDTIVDTEDVQARMQLPLTIGGGIALTHGLFWKVGLNYESSFWANQFEYDARQINMGNSYEIAIGGEFCPMPKDLNIQNYGQRIRYRLGGYYGKDPRIVGTGADAVQLNKYGLNFGLGLPLKPLKSGILGYTNLAFEVGYMGHPDLIGETFFKVNLAFTLNDGGWFRRARFR
jgi:hypothetical protein